MNQHLHAFDLSISKQKLFPIVRLHADLSQKLNVSLMASMAAYFKAHRVSGEFWC